MSANSSSISSLPSEAVYDALHGTVLPPLGTTAVCWSVLPARRRASIARARASSSTRGPATPIIARPATPPRALFP